MKNLALVLVLSFIVMNNINGQEIECKMTVKLVENDINFFNTFGAQEQLNIYYAANFIADSIDVVYTPETRRVLGFDSIIMFLNNQYYTVFTRMMVAYSPEVWIPGANIYQNDTLKCTIAPHLILTDTLKSTTTEQDTTPNSNKKPTATVFKWDTGDIPKVTISLKETANLGDTLHVGIKANFPIEAILPQLKSKNLKLVSSLHSNYNLTIINGETTRSYSQFFVFEVVKTGSVAFKKDCFKYEGKKAKIPKVPISIYQ
jgi:hypothetical protein